MNTELQNAYSECRRIAEHYENFPVGSVLVPKRLRKHFFALYAFMRSADDFADFPSRPREERLKLLEDWRFKLQHVLTGGKPDHPVFLALANTISECQLPGEPLEKLLEAFEFDARGDVRFETFEDLRWYTSRSADPVGELVLALFGYRDEKRIRLSNDICTGLQLLNFIQDIKEDLTNDRYYYPREDWQMLGLDLSKTPDQQRLALLSLFELERVESLIDRGAPLTHLVSGRLAFELRAVVHSAQRLCSKIERIDGNSYAYRPKLTKRERLSVLLQSLLFKVV